MFPNTPFPYHFDVGNWVGVNRVNGIAKDAGKTRVGREIEVDKEGNEEKKEGEKIKGESAEVTGVEDETMKEKEKEMEVSNAKENRDKTKDGETGEVQVIEQTISHKEADDILDIETRATILIPNGYIPREKPLKPALWGGGVIGRPSSLNDTLQNYLHLKMTDQDLRND